MDRFLPLLLDVWREVSRHLEICDSAARVAPILARRLPFDLLLVRRLDPQRGCVETLAAEACAGRSRPEATRNDCSAEELERLLGWCGREEVFRGSAPSPRLPALVPGGIEGHLLAGPLAVENGPPGLLVLAGNTRPFTPEHESLLQALLEPFAVALRNDHRLHELVTLREALEADNRSLLSRLGRHDISESIVGAETGLREVMEQVELVARADAPVLILGETGSGKEVVARAIHTRSQRANGPFLRVNCGAIPPELVDSELFGHDKGAFTNAVSVRKGWFERADEGTLFLDECGELPLSVQVRLLRILQDGTFQRVGGERQLKVNVRIIAATHRDLQAMVGEGRFREDLWYRIAVFPIRLPPLRERTQDIPSMASHFALRAARRLGTTALVPSPEDLQLLVTYPWPGNVRELAAVIERAAILGDGKRLEVARALGAAPQPLPKSAAPVLRVVSPPLLEEFPTLDIAITRHIEAALVRTRGRIEGADGAARLLDINPHTLRARMRKLGLDWSRFRARSA